MALEFFMVLDGAAHVDKVMDRDVVAMGRICTLGNGEWEGTANTALGH